jgi:pyruvate-ferredoxin/flavodoxin oxidoreductase
LFEDNAEFGLGMRISIDKHKEIASTLIKELSGVIGDKLVNDILNAKQNTEAEIIEQRKRVAELKKILIEPKRFEKDKSVAAARLLPIADYLVHKSV